MTNILNTTLFGKYEIISILGTGSFGTVYLSKHKFLESYCAIKQLPKHENASDSLLSEARLLKSLHHPGIPTIYDFEEDTGYFYLIEEYVEGESLEEFLLYQSQISLQTFWDFSLQLCDIFRYLHNLKPSPILYLDLKPEHIIVCGTKIKLIDFNVATYLSNLGNICTLLGNEDFSAPELFSGANPNLLSDIYSIGKIMEYLSKFLDVSISPKLHQIILKSTHTDSTCRFETVDELILAINQEKISLNQSHLCKKIAVVGSHPGCGTTHIAISLVSTLNYMGYSSVYFAKNSHADLFHPTSYIPFFKEHHGMLSYKFFKGYPFYGPGIRLPNPDDMITVYDYNDNPSLYEIDADLILFICSNSIWHWQSAFEKGESLLTYKDRLKIICNMGQKKHLHHFSKQFCLPVYFYPFDQDAFHVDKNKCDVFRALLNIKGRKSIFFYVKNLFFKKP